MKYSIFHTSHCGSTLLACYLSKSIPTFTEPNWSHKAIKIEDLWERVDFVKEHHQDNTLVKYSSLICNIAPHIDGKKVFLYRNFEDHLKKLSTCTEHFKVDQEAFFWTQRFTYLAISQDVLYIQSDYFLNNREKVARIICDHFEIDYVPVNLPKDFNAKEEGYNHHIVPIKL